MKKYQQQCPPTQIQQKRGTFNLVRYREEFAASSAVINNDVGVMMHKRRYVAWAQTAENPDGIATLAGAEAAWTQMEEAAKRGEWLHNSKGPTGEPLQLRIKTQEQVIFQDQFAHSKVQECQQNKDVKKASMESVEAGRRSLLRDHERGLGKQGEHQDFGGIAQAMLQNVQSAGGSSRDSAFAGSGVFMPDLIGMQGIRGGRLTCRWYAHSANRNVV